MSLISSQHSRPLTVTVFCCMEAKSFSLLFWSIHAWGTKWKVNFNFFVYFHIKHLAAFLLFHSIQHIYWLVLPWTVFDGGFWETHRDTQRFPFICCIYCVLLKYNLTDIFCWLCREIWERFPPTPYHLFLRNPTAGNQN